MSEPGSTSRPLPSPAPGIVPSTSSGGPLLSGVDGGALGDHQPTVVSNPSAPRPAPDATVVLTQWRLLPGDRLGDFELVDFVGGGGMGRVFRARDVRLHRNVALKVLSPDQAADPSTLARFQNEAQSAARLDHQNIARVYHVGEDRGIPYIAFEFVEGLNVRDLVVKKGPLDLAEALSYALQVAEGLMHAASRSVVHRDIKPSNVIVTPEGTAKLIDLGLARLHRLGNADDLTASGVTLGTFDYISPEQARDPRTADVRSDIYSFGCTIYYMLTARPPFPEGTVLQKLLQHQGDAPTDVRQIRPDLPDEMARILRKALAKDPRHRYQSPGELLEEMLRLAEQIGLRPMRSGSSRVMAAPRHAAFWGRHLPWAAPALALVTIVLALDFFGPSREEAKPPSPLAADAHIPPPTPDAPPSQPAAATPDAESAANKTPATPPATPTTTPSVTPSTTPPSATESKPPVSPLASTPTPTPTPQASVTPPTTAPAVPPARNGTGHAGVLIVGEAGEGEKAFPTLSAACAAASNGDVIQVRANGRRVLRPVSLANLKVTIQAGEGFRPVLAFRPTDAEPMPYPRSMISLQGGHLTLRNLAFELEVPRELPAEKWSLVEVVGDATLRVENCWLTVRNPAGQQSDDALAAACLRFSAPPGGDGPMASGGGGSGASVELADCVVRGEASFLVTDALQPLQVNWDNGLLSTSGYLLVTEGGAAPPRSGDMRRFDLRHLTVAAKRGLCRMSVSPSAPHQMLTRLSPTDCIFLGNPTSPLVEQVALDSPVECRRWLEWNGERVFYQGWDVFWTIHAPDARTPAESLSFEAWQLYWGADRESLPERNQVTWQKLPDPSREPSTHTPSDFALLPDASKNAARGAASDGDDVGLRPERLPAPPEPSAEPTPVVPAPTSLPADRTGGLTAPTGQR